MTSTVIKIRIHLVFEAGRFFSFGSRAHSPLVLLTSLSSLHWPCQRSNSKASGFSAVSHPARLPYESELWLVVFRWDFVWCEVESHYDGVWPWILGLKWASCRSISSSHDYRRAPASDGILNEAHWDCLTKYRFLSFLFGHFFPNL